MTNEELVKLYQEGDNKALDTLIEQNKGIVYKLVNRFYTEGTSSIDREDLEQEGTIGLIMAAKRYNLEYVNKATFITYAVYWINQKISRFIKHRSTNEEISINTPLNDGDDITLEDSLVYDGAGPEEIAERKIIRKEIEEVLNDTLSLKEREIVKFRNGWDNNNPMTLEAIGEMLDFSRERTRQLEVRAYRKLRSSPWGMKKRAELHQEELRILKAERNRSFYANERYLDKVNEIKRLYDRGILKDPFAEYIARRVEADGSR